MVAHVFNCILSSVTAQIHSKIVIYHYMSKYFDAITAVMPIPYSRVSSFFGIGFLGVNLTLAKKSSSILPQQVL